MTYCFASFGESHELLDNRTGLNAAQIGGLVAHAMEDCKAFIVRDEASQRIVIRYDREGVSRTENIKKPTKVAPTEYCGNCQSHDYLTTRTNKRVCNKCGHEWYRSEPKS